MIANSRSQLYLYTLMLLITLLVGCNQIFDMTTKKTINPDNKITELVIEGTARIPLKTSSRLHVTLNKEKYLGTVDWSSSHEDIIKINSFGVVKGLNIGFSEITVTSEDGFSGSTMLEVYDPTFITLWRVPAGGEVLLPLALGNETRGGAPIEDRELYIDWGDGSDIELIMIPIQGGVSHSYENAGDYQVKICGILKMSVWSFLQVPQSKDMFIDVLNWGGAVISNNLGAFAGCENLLSFSAKDAPILEGFVDSMFFGATNFTGEGVSHWDISSVTSMKSFFESASSLNTSFSLWDVTDKQVTSMFLGSGLIDSEDHPIGCANCGICPEVLE